MTDAHTEDYPLVTLARECIHLESQGRDFPVDSSLVLIQQHHTLGLASFRDHIFYILSGILCK